MGLSRLHLGEPADLNHERLSMMATPAAAHLLQVNDVAEALAAGPEVLVVGMGQPGRMQVDQTLAAFLKEKGIDLVAVPTKEACRVINSLAGKRRLAAALHLTC